jgi:AraC-like DNA-binding protein
LIAEARLDTACHLLAESDERIAGIAARLGFSSPSSFNRTFMRLMKTQPGAYRRLQLSQTGRTGRRLERRRHLPAAPD